MAEAAGLAVGVVALLDAVLNVVEVISTARDDCKDAPLLTRSLVNKVDNAKSVLQSISSTVKTYPGEDWNDLKPNLVKLSAVLEEAAVDVELYARKDEKRKDATHALEVLKACFKVGAAKQKKATQDSLKQVDDQRNALLSIVQAHVLNTVYAVSHKLEENRGAVPPLHVQAVLHLTLLQDRAALDMANELLKDINVEVEGEGKSFSSPKPNQQVTSQIVSPSSKETSGTRGRVSGTQVRNSTKIRFNLGVSGTGEWFFHIVTCDLHEKPPSPKLFFPRNLNAQNNKLVGNAGRAQQPRTFPCKQPFGPSKYDPDGLTLDRSDGVSADGDSPWAVFIIITSTQLLPKGDGDKSKSLLTIEDIAEALRDEGVGNVYVKAFLFDIIKQADVASSSTRQ